jgi:hypothetical protein
MTFTVPILTKLRITQRHDVEIVSVEFHQTQLRNVDSTGRNLFTPVSKIWLSPHWFSWNSNLRNKFLWRFLIPNFMSIWKKSLLIGYRLTDGRIWSLHKVLFSYLVKNAWKSQTGTFHVDNWTAFDGLLRSLSLLIFVITLTISSFVERLHIARFEVFTAVFLSVQGFWDTMLCCWVADPRRLEGTTFHQNIGYLFIHLCNVILWKKWVESLERSRTIYGSTKKVKWIPICGRKVFLL